jgi:hypothetical protein
MGTKAEKRIQRRILLEDLFTLHHQGKPCRVVDISVTGLGISYISGEDWPEKITLEYSLNQESGQKRLVQCRTVWETTMNFYKTRTEEVVRRRGLEFIEQGSGDVGELHQHLRSLAEVDQ